MPDDIYYEQPEQQAEDPTVDASGDMTFPQRVSAVRLRLKAPKSQWNSFGSYFYRSCEDILEGLKPLLDEYGLMLALNDEIVFVEGRFYVKSTATIYDARLDTLGRSMSASAYAREPENRKGSDQSQVTGSCSSYARKYALNALFLIDDTKDADTPQPGKTKDPPAQGPFLARCRSCGTQYQFADQGQYRQFITNPGCCQSPQWEVM